MTTLEQVARWLDREYEQLTKLPAHGSTEDALQIQGAKAATAEYAALIRSWASTGKEPPTRRVAARHEWAHEHLCQSEPDAPRLEKLPTVPWSGPPRTPPLQPAPVSRGQAKRIALQSEPDAPVETAGAEPPDQPRPERGETKGPA